MLKLRNVLVLLLTFLIYVGQMSANDFINMKLKTGDVLIKLRKDLAPNHVKRISQLVKDGFYDGLTFHRVLPDFVIQGGCPQGTGIGGPGYQIKCVLDGDNQFHDKGVLSMAHAGRDTGGSQFFICHSRNNTAHLDRNHTCFGKVVEGLEVIDDIRQGDEIEKIVDTIKNNDKTYEPPHRKPIKRQPSHNSSSTLYAHLLSTRKMSRLSKYTIWGGSCF